MKHLPYTQKNSRVQFALDGSLWAPLPAKLGGALLGWLSSLWFLGEQYREL